MSSEDRFHRRLGILLACLAAGALAVAGRLVQLQTIEAARYGAQAARQHNATITLDGRRGEILDRDGRAIAVSVEADSAYIDPTALPDGLTTLAVAREAARVLGVDGADLGRRLAADTSFVWVKRKLTAEERARADASPTLRAALHYRGESRRAYPRGTFAAHLVGFTGTDGNGLEGLEREWDSKIRGEGARFVILKDGRGHGILEQIREEGRPGASLELTIDERIQFAAESELEAAMQATGSAKGTVIVADPRTGEILAMASRPVFDPNAFGRAPATSRRNVAVGDRYEPGSTFKIITAAAGLEEGRVRLDEWFDCGRGVMTINGRVLHDAHPNGSLVFADVIARSSNIGIIKLGLRLGAPTLEEYVRGFGFGATTGVGLSSEAEGIVRGRWSQDTLMSVSMGHEVLVTPIQMLQAFSALANGGVLVPPSVVRAVIRRDGGREAMPAKTERRVVSPATCRQLVSMMERVVDRGTARRAVIPGYRVAGKTGTAQKIGPDGKYSHTSHVASFVGFAPATDPRVAAIVMLDDPKGGAYYGGDVAAPCFGRVVGVALEHLRVRPDLDPDPAAPGPPAVQEYPDWRRTPRDAKQDPEEEEAWPPEREALPADVMLVRSAPGRPVVPDLYGKGLRESVSLLSALGLRVASAGTGFVTKQDPPAGSPAQPEAVVRLSLSLTPPATPANPPAVAAAGGLTGPR